MIALTLLAKNEIDIIKTTLSYHLPKVDFIIVTDNGSTDGTLEFLESQQSEKVFLIKDPTPTFDLKSFYNRMILLSYDKGADWVINCDADEFYVGDIRNEVELATEYDTIVIRKCKYFVPTYLDNLCEQNPIRRMTWYTQNGLDVGYRGTKVIHRTKRFRKISQGNHDVNWERGYEAKIVNSETLQMFHYGYRSYEQFKKKIVEHGTTIINHPPQRASIGVHKRKIFEKYQQNGEEAMKEEWNKVYLYDQLRFEDQIIPTDKYMRKFLQRNQGHKLIKHFSQDTTLANI